MSEVEFAIVGGGPTGLGAARRLLELGRRDVVVLEREPVFGGLAGSVGDAAGFTWDYGCHVQHSHYAHFDRAMDAALGREGWLEHERVSAVALRGRLVPYPFQLNTHRLDPRAARRCLDGLRDARRRASEHDQPPRHFEDWALRTFGAGIQALFLGPYNAKVWALPTTRLDWRWVAERVAVPDVAQLERCLRGEDQTDWGTNSRFRYPARGGAGAPWRALAAGLPDALKRPGCTVVDVDLCAHRLGLASGESLRYRHLISSAPLDQLAGLTGRAELREAARGLLHAETHVIGLGLRGQPPAALGGMGWIYFPEADVPFHRVSVPSHFSPANVPDARTHWSLLLEVSAAPGADPLETEALIEACIAGCLRARLFEDASQVCQRWSAHLARGYPTPSLSRDGALAVLQPALAAHDVWSRGRFGAWRYEVSNQDHSFMQGVEVVDRLLGRVDGRLGSEPTLGNRITRGQPGSVDTTR